MCLSYQSIFKISYILSLITLNAHDTMFGSAGPLLSKFCTGTSWIRQSEKSNPTNSSILPRSLIFMGQSTTGSSVVWHWWTGETTKPLSHNWEEYLPCILCNLLLEISFHFLSQFGANDYNLWFFIGLLSEPSIHAHMNHSLRTPTHPLWFSLSQGDERSCIAAFKFVESKAWTLRQLPLQPLFLLFP